MSQNNSHEALTHPDLKRKHPECGSKSKEYPVPLSAIPVPPPPLSTKPAATVDPEKPPVKQRLPAKKICLSLPSQPVSDSAKKESRRLKPVSGDVAKVFGDDDESEEEEMPIEARIRMRNKGRETPTSSGPNSFGKGRFGFVDRRALLDRQLEALNEQVSGDNEDGCGTP
uniref:PEST proteolytic signal-containing nuclear protein n=1 Tax=Mesocestoides corti TaxID=53468 RepID=A0A5K3F5J5_MESCO